MAIKQKQQLYQCYMYVFLFHNWRVDAVQVEKKFDV